MENKNSKTKKINIKKIIYITLLSVLGVIFVSSLVFGAIAAYSSNAKESIELWYSDKLDANISLLKHSIKWLLISAALLVVTLSAKEIKSKLVD